MTNSILSREVFDSNSNRMHKLAALLETKGDPVAAYSVLRGMFMPQQRQELLASGAANWVTVDDTRSPSDVLRVDQEKADSVNMYSRLELSNYLSQTLLRDADVMSMVHGLEVRVPLIDHQVVEQVALIPGRLKIRHQENKPLLVDAVKGLPRGITHRKKMGFTFPLGIWLREGLKEWAESLLLGEAPKQLNFLNARTVEKVWYSFLRGENYTSYSRVWCMVALIAWCQEHRIHI